MLKIRRVVFPILSSLFLLLEIEFTHCGLSHYELGFISLLLAESNPFSSYSNQKFVDNPTLLQ